jgi:dihydroorotate dehydrogenase (NAD+) catalytic subunit
VDLNVELCGLRLHTPLVPAAGTHGKEAVQASEGVYGAVLPKTVTPQPRTGNPPPRLAETPAGMINSIGLQNPGVERFMEELDAFDTGVPLFVSVAGETAGDYSLLCGRLAADDRVRAIELNLSCPNVERGGLYFCAVPASVEEVVAAAVEAAGGKPVLAKLASEGAVEGAQAAERAGAAAVTLINTLPALAVDARRREVRLRGGLSGPAIKPVALRAVYEAFRAVGIPILGCGGVATGTDVAEFMLAGATAVQIGSAGFVRDPREILREFSGYLRETGLDARDLIGAAH